MELEQCINYLLTTAQHTVFQIMSSKLSPFDITPVQYGVLHCLWNLDKKTPKEIAEKLKLENSTISGVLERMEKKGLLQRSISKEDRRFVQIVLTQKGKELKKPVLDAVDEVNKEVMAVLPEEDQKALKDSLRILGGIS